MKDGTLEVFKNKAGDLLVIKKPGRDGGQQIIFLDREQWQSVWELIGKVCDFGAVVEHETVKEETPWQAELRTEISHARRDAFVHADRLANALEARVDSLSESRASMQAAIVTLENSFKIEHGRLE